MRDETLQKKVGQRIRELRLQKGYSQNELSLKCDFEKPNLSRLESGRDNSTLATLNRIANGLEVNIIELFKF